MENTANTNVNVNVNETASENTTVTPVTNFSHDMALDQWNTTSTDIDEFYTSVTKLTDASTWIAGIPSKELLIKSIAGPVEVAEVMDTCKTSYDIAYDTCDSSHLMIQVGLNTYCVRDTCLSTLFDTAKIQGSALGRLAPDSLAEVLNRCLQVAKGSSLILHQAGKVAATLSDNAGGYRAMPQTQLVDITIDKVTSRLGTLLFKSGYVDHSVSTFLAELPDAQAKLNVAYNNAINGTGRHVDLMPSFIFTTSDVGKSAATLRPIFRPINEDYYYPINSGIRVEHIRGKENGSDGLDRFAEEAELLHAKFNETAESINRMAQVTLTYPLNTYIAVCKKIGIPRKYAKEGYEDLANYCGGDPCSAHDLYLSLTRCFGVAMRLKASQAVRLGLEDAVAHVFTLKWDEFDLPGGVAWGMAA